MDIRTKCTWAERGIDVQAGCRKDSVRRRVEHFQTARRHNGPTRVERAWRVVGVDEVRVRQRAKGAVQVWSRRTELLAAIVRRDEM